MNKVQFDQKQKENIIKSYLNGKSSVYIAKEINVSPSTITRYLHKNNIQLRGPSYMHRKYEIDEYFFEKIDTSEKAQILGVWMADGWNCDKKRSSYLALAEEDTEYLEKINKVLKYNKPIEIYQTAPGFKKNQKTARISIYNKKISNDLASKGCNGNKTENLIFPKPEIVPEYLLSHFVRGYFEGDGWTTKHKSSTCSTAGICGTEAFCLGIQKVLKEKLKITSTVFNISNKCSKVSFSKRKFVIDFLNWIYCDAPFVMERKFRKYNEIKSIIPKYISH